MSTPPPPPAPPPGNYYPPPVPPPSNSAGCWKAAGLTCGVLFLLALIGVIFVGQAIRKNMDHPTRGSIIGTGILVFRVTQDGQTLQRAVVQYKGAHGHYPSSLLDLVRDGKVDGKILHNDLDPNPSVGSISWQYSKPAPGAPGNTPLLTEHYLVGVPGGKGSAGSGTITITLDGQAGSMAGGTSRTTFGKPLSNP